MIECFGKVHTICSHILIIVESPSPVFSQFEDYELATISSAIDGNPGTQNVFKVYCKWDVCIWRRGPHVQCAWLCNISQIAKFMGPTWGPPGSCRPQMGPMLAPWTLLSGLFISVARQTGNSVLFLSVLYWTLCAVLEILLYTYISILSIQPDFNHVHHILLLVLVRNDEIKMFNQSHITKVPPPWLIKYTKVPLSL